MTMFIRIVNKMMMMMLIEKRRGWGWCRLIYCSGRKELLQNGADPSYNLDDDDDDYDIIQP